MVLTGDQARERARQLFIDEAHRYGCAETTLLVLEEAFELPDDEDVAPAMALNGGLAYSGGLCGAVSGAALAVGRLAAGRVADRALAKRMARRIVAGLLEDFRAAHGALDCRALLGMPIDTPAAHRAFLESGVWRRVCLAQVEFVVGRLAHLPGDPVWASAARHRPA